MKHHSQLHLPVKNAFFWFFAGFYLFTVYTALYYKRIGFSSKEIGALTSLYYGVGMIAGPVLGVFADRSRDPRRILQAGLFVGAVSLAGIYTSSEFLPIFFLLLLFAAFYGPLVPLLDALTIGTLRRIGGDYGRIRLWGTIGFVLSAVAIWPVLDWKDNLRLVIPFFLVYASIAFILFGRYPHDGRPASSRLDFSGFRLLRKPQFLVFLMATSFHSLAIIGFYTFFSIYLESRGVPSAYNGLIWVIGPAAEVGAFFVAGRFIARWGIKRVLLFSYGATALRLLILSVTPPLAVVLATQLLHAGSYGTLHSASVAFLARQAKETNRSSVQTLYTGAMQLAYVMGPLLAGVLVGNFSLATMFFVYGSVALAALVFFLVFFRERAHRPEDDLAAL